VPDSSFYRSRVGYLVLYLGALFYTAVLASNGAGFLGCGFRSLTGYSCFGCGMTRSWTNFLHGDLSTSLHFHPFGAITLIISSLLALLAVYELVRKRRAISEERSKKVEKFFWPIALVLVVTFGLIRFGLEWVGILTPV